MTEDQMAHVAVLLYVLAAFMSAVCVVQWVRSHLRSDDDFRDARHRWRAAQILTAATVVIFVTALSLSLIIRYAEIGRAQVNCC